MKGEKLENLLASENECCLCGKLIRKDFGNKDEAVSFYQNLRDKCLEKFPHLEPTTPYGKEVSPICVGCYTELKKRHPWLPAIE